MPKTLESGASLLVLLSHQYDNGSNKVTTAESKNIDFLKVNHNALFIMQRSLH